MEKNIQINQNRQINSLGELKNEALALFNSAQKEIQIYSHNLDPRILSSSQIETVIKGFIRSSRYVKVELLIYDENNMRNFDHRLVRLSQRYTSNVKIKIVPKDFHENHFTFYLVDNRRMVYRSNFERFEAEYLQLPNAKVNQKSRLFDDIWQQSDPASFLRALTL